MRTSRTEILTFEVRGLRYGVFAGDVVEVLRAVTVHPLPKAPAVISGVINFHGKIVPVLDVAVRFRLLAKDLGPSDQFIVARAAGRLVALHIERALDLLQLGPLDLEYSASIAPTAEYISGVAKLPDGLVIIHDLHAFLTQAEALELDAALADTEDA